MLDDLGPPRHRGFSYNWARSGATTADAIADGQHTGLAGQVAAGLVDLAYVFIGGNDFIEALDAVRPQAALPEADVTRIAHRIAGAHVCAYQVKPR